MIRLESWLRRPGGNLALGGSASGFLPGDSVSVSRPSSEPLAARPGKPRGWEKPTRPGRCEGLRGLDPTRVVPQPGPSFRGPRYFCRARRVRPPD